MALKVYLQLDTKCRRLSDSCEFVTQFKDDEGYFYFLNPFFEEVWLKTDQDIDFYTGAIFCNRDLQELKLALVKAQELAKSQPESWTVWTGDEQFPNIQAPHLLVEKMKLINVLNSLRVAIDKAQARNWCILFFGD